VALYDSAKDIRLPLEAPGLFLHSRSVSGSLSGDLKPPSEALVTVVSRWPDFLRWSHTTLIASGVDASALDLRDARKKGWERGLASRDFIITDRLLAGKLPAACRAHVFQIISDESITVLKAAIQTWR
jgi:hypothetical protein